MSSRMRHEVLQRAEQKGAETSFFAIGTGIGTRLDQVLEESLRQVLRVFGTRPLPRRKRKIGLQ